MALLVTGGTKGLGLATARRLARTSACVFLNYASDATAADEARRKVESEGAEAILLPGDIGTAQGAAEVINGVRTRGHVIDHLVHCAIEPASGSLLTMDPSLLMRVLAVNAASLVFLAQAARDLLRRGSSLIYVSSKAGRSILPGFGAVGAAKALGEHLIRYLAIELAPLGVRANCVAPGVIDTTTLRRLKGNSTDEFLRIQAASNPSGRNLNFEDFTSVIEFLISPAAEMVQGQVIFVNGGAYIAG